MRETTFIGQNEEKWKEAEALLQGKPDDPDRAAELFVQVSDDLSFSRTFYPNRSVRSYLNDLAKRLYFQIYRYPHASKGRMLHFWSMELPLVLYSARRDLLLSFLVFWGAFGIGVLSSALDPDFASQILGADYVEMTKSFIESGDPMAVYKQMGAFDMAFGITANNLYVAFLSFILGIFYTIGSFFVLLRNGIMVGAFQYFFIQEGLFLESFLTIWIHGTLEISAIILAAGAGITMGRGIAFPGTYTRGQAFRHAARRGLKIMLGVVPILVLAAFFEGFLTRYTETPDVLRGLFIGSCLVFVVVYFVWVPRRIAAAFGSKLEREAEVVSEQENVPDLSRIRSTGELFNDLFFFLRRGMPFVLRGALAAAGLFCVLLLLSGIKGVLLFDPGSGIWASISSLKQIYAHPFVPWAYLVNIPVLAVFSAWMLPRLFGKTAVAGTLVTSSIKLLIPATMLVVLLHSIAQGMYYAGSLAIPVLLLWIIVLALEPGMSFWGIVRLWRVLRVSLTRVVLLFVLLSAVGAFFFSLLDTALVWMFFDLIGWVIQLPEVQMEHFSAISQLFITYFFQYVAFAFLFSGFGLCYYTLLEIAEAGGLYRRIQEISIKRQIRGLEQESL